MANTDSTQLNGQNGQNWGMGAIRALHSRVRRALPKSWSALWTSTQTRRQFRPVVAPATDSYLKVRTNGDVGLRQYRAFHLLEVIQLTLPADPSSLLGSWLFGSVALLVVRLMDGTGSGRTVAVQKERSLVGILLDSCPAPGDVKGQVLGACPHQPERPVAGEGRQKASQQACHGLSGAADAFPF
jgi:hypothetical protein